MRKGNTMNLYRIHTRLNGGQCWSDYDIVAKTVLEAVKRAQTIIPQHEGIKKEGLKGFNGKKSPSKQVEIIGVELISSRVWT